MLGLGGLVNKIFWELRKVSKLKKTFHTRDSKDGKFFKFLTINRRKLQPKFALSPDQLNGFLSILNVPLQILEFKDNISELFTLLTLEKSWIFIAVLVNHVFEPNDNGFLCWKV